MLRDLILAVRRLTRRPVLAVLATSTLTIAIGAVSSTFGLVNDALIRPLPYPRADRLVAIRSIAAGTDGRQIGPGVSHANYLDLARETRTLSALAAYATESPTLSVPDAEATLVTSAPITATLASTLGVRPILGRGIAPEDDRPDAVPVAVLGHDLWASRFGADSSLLGKPIVLDGLPHRVIGVLPPGVAFPRTAQLWTALGSLPGVVFRAQHGLQVVGRLADNATLPNANAELRRVMSGLVSAFPRENAGRSLEAVDLHGAVVGPAARPVRLLWLATVAVWLLACVNIAWLLLARAVGERQELAVRRALGSTARQLAAPWLHECLVLVAVSAVAGSTLSVLWSRWLATALGTAQSVGHSVVDWRVLAATLVCALATMLILACVPAIVAARTRGVSALRGASSGTARDGVGRSAASGLIAGQVAGAVVLSWAAIVLTRSLDRATRVDLGFAPRSLSVVALRLPPYEYRDESRIRDTYAAILDAVRAIPGVDEAAVALVHPLQAGFAAPFQIAGDASNVEGRARLRSVSDAYFRTVGVRILAGRDVATTDRADGPRVAIVNEALVSEYFPGRPAIGQRLLRRAFGSPEPLSYEIVGVVGNERFSGAHGTPEPAVYIPFTQMPFASANILMRTRGLPDGAVVRSLRTAVWTRERAVPVDAVQSMEDIAAGFLTTPRTLGTVLGAFAAVAGLLMVIGIHGILAQTVSQRRRDLAVRRALGATSGHVVGSTVRGAATATLVGGIIGAGLALWFARVIRPFAFETPPADPAVVMFTALILAACVAFGAAVPAWRATRVAPASALRE